MNAERYKQQVDANHAKFSEVEQAELSAKFALIAELLNYDFHIRKSESSVEKEHYQNKLERVTKSKSYNTLSPMQKRWVDARLKPKKRKQAISEKTEASEKAEAERAAMEKATYEKERYEKLKHRKAKLTALSKTMCQGSISTAKKYFEEAKHLKMSNDVVRRFEIVRDLLNTHFHTTYFDSNKDSADNTIVQDHAKQKLMELKYKYYNLLAKDQKHWLDANVPK